MEGAKRGGGIDKGQQAAAQSDCGQNRSVKNTAGRYVSGMTRILPKPDAEISERPACLKCGLGMWLVRPEPIKLPGHDDRMAFECVVCERTQIVLWPHF